MSNLDYDSRFYEGIHETSQASASEVVPLVTSLLNPSSVLDVGCGTGTWLVAFRAHGVSVRGVDAKYVDRSQLKIEQSEFEHVNLSQPFVLSGKYDLAVCLEVAEHLPRKMAMPLIEQLVDVAPVVLFSSAVPGQGGTAHINEQWHSYWHKRFQRVNFECFDVIRPKIVTNSEVAWWYRQNMFVYAKKDSPKSKELAGHCISSPMEIVAPNVFRMQTNVGALLRNLPAAIWRAARNRLSD